MIIEEVETTRAEKIVDRVLMVLWAALLWIVAACIAVAVYLGTLTWCAVAWLIAFDGCGMPDILHTIEQYASVPVWVYALGSGPAALVARSIAISIPRTLNGGVTGEAVFPPKWR